MVLLTVQNNNKKILNKKMNQHKNKQINEQINK